MSWYEFSNLGLLAGIIGLATVFGALVGFLTSWLLNSSERRHRKEQNNEKTPHP